MRHEITMAVMYIKVVMYIFARKKTSYRIYRLHTEHLATRSKVNAEGIGLRAEAPAAADMAAT